MRKLSTGTAMEIIRPLLYDDGAEIPIELRFPADIVETLVDVTGEESMPADWWTYDGTNVYPPVES